MSRRQRSFHGPDTSIPTFFQLDAIFARRLRLAMMPACLWSWCIRVQRTRAVMRRYERLGKKTIAEVASVRRAAGSSGAARERDGGKSRFGNNEAS